MNENLATVHGVIEYLLTKAAVSGKVSTKVIRIPYKDLLNSIGQSTDKNIDLVLTISMDWDEQTGSET